VLNPFVVPNRLGPAQVAAVRALTLTLVAAMIPQATARAQSGESLPAVEAVTNARHDLKLGFTVGGRVDRIAVEPGQSVQKGDVLMELDNKEGKALIKIYQARADSGAQIKVAKERANLAQTEYDLIIEREEREVYDEGGKRRRKAELAVAEAELEVAKMQQKEAGLQLEQAQARADRYLLKAPMNGIVEQLIVNEGEVVEQLKPVLRLVVADPLRIDAAVPTHRTLGLQVDGRAYVQVRQEVLPGFEGYYHARIVHIANVADAASGTRLVRLEMPNPQAMPAGTPVDVLFDKPAGIDVKNTPAEAQPEDPPRPGAAQAQPAPEQQDESALAQVE
jgi:RND family efflux transporter MFP subunit